MVPVSDQDMNTHLAEVSRVRLCIIYTNVIIQNNGYFIWFYCYNLYLHLFVFFLFYNFPSFVLSCSF